MCTKKSFRCGSRHFTGWISLWIWTASLLACGVDAYADLAFENLTRDELVQHISRGHERAIVDYLNSSFNVLYEDGEPQFDWIGGGDRGIYLNRSDSSKRFVRVCRPDLSVALVRPSPDEEFVITAMDRGEFSRDDIVRRLIGTNWLIFAPFCYYEMTTVDFLRRSDVDIKAIETVHEDDQKIVRVRWRWDNSGTNFVSEGELDFLPNRNWLLDSHRRGEDLDTAYLDLDFSYDPSNDKDHLIKGFQYTTIKQGTQTSRDASLVAVKSRAAEPTDTFNLSRYGIADDTGLVRSPPMSTAYLLTLAGAGLFTLAALILLVRFWKTR